MAFVGLLFLAIVQAATEFLPVSSSGHLIIVSEISGIESSLAVDVLLHIGTLFALVWFYRQKITETIQQKDTKLFRNLIISSIPAVFAGVAFASYLASGSIRSSGVVATMLILVGLVMVFEKRLFVTKKSMSIDSLSPKQALVIGLAQMVALIPGTSRSGASIIGGRLVGLNNSSATDYAFLIGIPVIFGATLKVLFGNEAQQFILSYPFDALVGVLVTAVCGWLALITVLKVVKNTGLKWFGIYRITVALLLLSII